MTTDPVALTILGLAAGDPVTNLGSLLAPDGTLCYVPAKANYFKLNINDSGSTDGNTRIGASGGGVWATIAGIPSGVDVSSLGAVTSLSGASPINIQPGGALVATLATPTVSGTVGTHLGLKGLINVYNNNGANDYPIIVARNAANNADLEIVAYQFGALQFGNTSETVSLLGSSVSLTSGAGTPVTLTNASHFQLGLNDIGGSSGHPFQLAASSVTVAANGTTTLSAAQQGTPMLRAATVTLTGNITIDFGGVVGQFWLNFRLVTVGANTVTLKNGAGTQVVTSLIATSPLLTIDCDTTATVVAK